MSIPGRDAVRIRQCRVAFGGSPVVDARNLAFGQGAVSVLLGPSGSGKTTLLRAVNRLNECFRGCETRADIRVRLGGEWLDVQAAGTRGQPSLETLRRTVGMVFQTPNVLPASVRRNMALPLRLALGLRGRDADARLEEALAEAQLWDEVKDRLHADARTLSGGQQQRLCLARALALRPEILLLDEPTASLDFRAAGRIEELLLSLRERYAQVVVSHSLRQARRLADRLYVFQDGRHTHCLERGELASEARFRALVEAVF
jgi:phosphate transport system ATP-binding protein